MTPTPETKRQELEDELREQLYTLLHVTSALQPKSDEEFIAAALPNLMLWLYPKCHLSPQATDAWANIEEKFEALFVKDGFVMDGGDLWMKKVDVKSFLKKHIEAAEQRGKEGMHDTTTVIEANDRGFDAGYQQGFTHSSEATIRDFNDGFQAGAETFKAKAIAAANTIIEKYEDKGDERYGLVKHWNSLGQHFLDDLIAALNALPLTETE